MHSLGVTNSVTKSESHPMILDIIQSREKVGVWFDCETRNRIHNQKKSDSYR